MDELVIGVDVGGSHIKSAAVNLENGSVLAFSAVEVKINNKASADVIAKDWAKAINQTIAAVGAEAVTGIGFAMPGAFNYKEGIALFEGNDKYENLYGLKVEKMLRPLVQLGNVPFRFHNDASCFAIGVDKYGVAGSSNKSICITLGTGFGSAFIDDGIPIVHRDDVPEDGCLWHLPFEEGIADDTFSTRWFINEYEKLFHEKLPGVKEIAVQYQGNKEVQEIFKRFGTKLGEFLAPWIKKFDAEIVVVGGNVSGAFNLFSKHVYDALEQSNAKVEFKVSVLKEDAALMGSARLLDDQYYDKVKDYLPTK